MGADVKTAAQKTAKVQNRTNAEDLATKYQAQTRTARYERRRTTARTHLENEVRQIRNGVDSQAGQVRTRLAGFTGRVEELISNARGSIR
jgi:hypothetical protein